ncbi:MAG TPA: CDP-glycerol glycerophosphotransferase family protein [Propionibacteriaceae bacterium]|nr:CDP-glycerol glycerophosphotransferase family protein [Propionibacteriaceae bacterium]
MTTNESTAVETAPTYSIITAVYNVATYLEEFIASIDAQDFPEQRLEVIAVDDGSTDNSLELLQAWHRRRPDLVTVLTKPNGGQSTARNLGLEVATGDWVTFTDPDDVIEPDYLSEVDAFLRANPTTLMVGTNRIMLNDTTKELTDSHPLRMHFRAGNRLRNLDELSTYFHGSAPAAFFKSEILRRHGLRFDPEVRPNFEDGHLCCRYLLAEGPPLVGFVATARYHYRKRQDSSSTLQRSLTDPDRYTKVLRNGYLALLRDSSAATGAPPEWLQNYVLYELSWYFSSQDSHAGAMSAASGDVADEFHELMKQILERISDDLITGFTLRPLKRIWKEIFLHSYADEQWHTPFVVVTGLDDEQSLVRLSYHFTGKLPTEEFLGPANPMRPRHAKIRDLAYHGRTLLQERIVWVPLRPLRVRLDGRYLDLRFSAPGFPVHALRVGDIRRVLARSKKTVVKKPGPVQRKPTRSAEDRLAARLADTPAVRSLFGNAWVLMDRIHDADDSAERLFRYLREKRPGINAWFVVESGTPDWDKLRSEPFARRVIPHGSLRWKLLMANCAHLVSSHADVPVMRPPAILSFTEPTWRFTFLQHGVIKDDLSQWLNGKRIDLFITSTQPEHDSIVGDHSPYVFTTKETKLTGLPRFDRLREQGERFGPSQRDLLLISPTWRNWLVPPLVAGSQKRALALDDFLKTDYARNWLSVLESPELARTAADRGLTIGFLPHPNLQSILDELALPSYVKALNFHDNDVQELFARSALLVTDYSSIAFNAAYINRPTVYFQFDSDLVLSGGHVGRQGYFDYVRDGFGPVAYDVDGAVKTIVAALENGPTPSAEYQQRIDKTFPLRDGRCCERVVREIERSTVKWGAKPPRPARRGRRFARFPLLRRVADITRPARTAIRSRSSR